MAAPFALEAYWLDALALLAALEGQPERAALLVGCADAHYREKGQQREVNEARAAARAEGLARTALGDEAWRDAHAQGALLTPAQAAAPVVAAGLKARPSGII